VVEEALGRDADGARQDRGHGECAVLAEPQIPLQRIAEQVGGVEGRLADQPLRVDRQPAARRGQDVRVMDVAMEGTDAALARQQRLRAFRGLDELRAPPGAPVGFRLAEKAGEMVVKRRQRRGRRRVVRGVQPLQHRGSDLGGAVVAVAFEMIGEGVLSRPFEQQ
jgi:hypothetical protein